MTYRALKSHTRRLLRQWLCGNSYTCGYSRNSCNRTLYAQGSEVHEQGGHVVFMIPYTYICIYVRICIYICMYIYMYAYIIYILYIFYTDLLYL